ncbi:hypothetical protein AURDEDRAFT_173634 [Auricularia subglabra TFB-10046 SS5]|uniref:Uncharacterized protein n=1 Tax=Auricularia subglabra (strain TFB-10046 / SS5) TaxID=717982 RepID=J0WVT9_AURST|nr:hypothetical protein AURDEDRAFT_173634 [Auricularia subglabra TFB-10046 SS5]
MLPSRIPRAPSIYSTIARRRHLRNLRLRDITIDALLQLGHMENISQMDVSFHPDVPRVVSLAWLFKIAQHAHVLVVDGVLLAHGLRTADAGSAPLTFAHVYGLSAHSDSALGISPTPRLVEAFPSLRSLSLGHNIARYIQQLLDYLDVLLPFLRHLELQDWDAGLLSPGHAISSLRLHVGQNDLILNPGRYVGLVASANVRALSLEWGSAGSFAIAEAAMETFRGLTSLSVRVRADEITTISTWLRVWVAHNVPPNLAVLTIVWTSPAALVQTVTRGDLVALCLAAPALKVLRLAKHTERGYSVLCAWRLSTTPRELDWDEACDISRECSHAAGVPRSPWDNFATF